MEFTCECCHYTTPFKSNYTKHLSSNKHIIHRYKQTTAYKVDVSKVIESQQTVIPQTPPSTPLVELSPTSGVFCKYCNKEYKHKSSLSKHNRYSCIKDDVLNDLKRTNQTLETEKNVLLHEKKELQKIFEIQSKQIEYLTCILALHARN